MSFPQVGHSAGAGKLGVLRQKVRLSILCALAAGATAFVALAALQYPVSAFFALTYEVCGSCSTGHHRVHPWLEYLCPVSCALAPVQQGSL